MRKYFRSTLELFLQQLLYIYDMSHNSSLKEWVCILYNYTSHTSTTCQFCLFSSHLHNFPPLFLEYLIADNGGQQMISISDAFIKGKQGEGFLSSPSKRACRSNSVQIFTNSVKEGVKEYCIYKDVTLLKAG